MRVLKSALPILLGHIPFAVAYALVARSAGLRPAEVMLMSGVVFAGASQMIVVTLMSEGVFLFSVLVLTTLLVNVRHLLMGASMAPHLVGVPAPLQFVAAFFLIDESFALSLSEAERSGFSLRYFFCVGLLFYLNWQLMTGIGLLLSEFIVDPFVMPVDFIMPLTFIVLVIPFLKTRPGVFAAIVAAITALLSSLVLPGYWYVPLAGIVAAATGALVEFRVGKRL